MPLVNGKAKLKPSRRRMAAKVLETIRDRIPASDAKLYLRAKPFYPIFPIEDEDLQLALIRVIDQLESVVNPT